MNNHVVQIETAHDGVITLPVERSRRRRKTLAIVPRRDGSLILQIPWRMSRKQVDEFILTERKWITQSILSASKRGQQNIKPNYVNYLGQSCPVILQTSSLLRNNGFCEMNGNQFIIHLPSHISDQDKTELAQDILKDWLMKQAEKIFSERADFYAPLLGVQYQSIKLTDPSTRWGSCDRSGNLVLSWRTIMAPMPLIDYLIVHELAHIIHFNHSARYWRCVEKVIPDYKARRDALNNIPVHFNIQLHV